MTDIFGGSDSSHRDIQAGPRIVACLLRPAEAVCGRQSGSRRAMKAEQQGGQHQNRAEHDQEDKSAVMGF